MKQILPILFLIGIVALSGCIGDSGATSSTNGIIIQSFTADPDQVEGNEVVYFTADIKNVGGAKATGVTGDLIGLPWSTDQTAGEECGTIYPPEPNIEGEACTFEWTGTAPPSQTTITYPVDVKINYHYATNYEALIRVASRDWIKGLPKDQQDSEKGKLGLSESSAQVGPIHATIVLRSPEVYSGQDTRAVLDIQNVGSGRPKDDFITVTVDQAQGVKCSSTGPIKLSQGKSKQIRCTLPTSGITDWQNIRIDVDLSYEYWVKTSTEVTVLSSPIV